MFELLRCPVCGEALAPSVSSLTCRNGHSFDIAKENYVNLLAGRHKSGDAIGDNRQMAHSRKSFLDKDFYFPLARALGNILSEREKSTVLDICCGEGYYTEKLMQMCPDNDFYGFDLSKEMVRLAAKRKCGASFFVANIANIPLADNSVDFAVHLFAPFQPDEFYRVIKPGGTLVTVIPGKRHLFGLKSVLYDSPYENDEKLPDTGRFSVAETVTVTAEINLSGSEDIMSLLRMTPYYYHTPTAGLERLSALSELKTEIQFLLVRCEKPSDLTQ